MGINIEDIRSLLNFNIFSNEEGSIQNTFLPINFAVITINKVPDSIKRTQ